MENIECRSMSSREKYWKELADTDKIERLRTVLKRKEAEIDSLENTIRRISELFENHRHQDDVLVVPLRTCVSKHFESDRRYSKEAEEKGEVYF